MSVSKLYAMIGGTMLFAASAAMAQPAVKNGEKIAFLGDSITQLGNGSSGYLNMVMKGLEANGIKAVKIPAGISGHKSNQMLDRLERDVLSKKPQIMTLSCGVNDVWHGARGITLPDYQKNITKIVESAQKAGIRVYLLTSTMIYENPQNDLNKKLAPYNDFLRQLAKEKHCVLVDLNADMQKEIAAIKAKNPDAKGNLLTYDGVHMAPLGNMMMAKGILRAFGLNDAELAKAEQSWDDMKWGQAVILTVKDYKKLSAQAFQSKTAVPECAGKLLMEHPKLKD